MRQLPTQESLFLDLPTLEEEEDLQRRVLEAIDTHEVKFTRRVIGEMGPAVEFVAAVWVADGRVEEVCGNLNSLNFLHAESTARRALAMLHDHGIQAALQLNRLDWEELASQVEWILKKINTARPDGHPRVRESKK
jgi:hypothetical protein